VVGVISVIVVLRGPIEEHLLRSSDDLFLALVAVLIGFALMSLTRGILSGSGRFGRYGLVVGMDGFFRAALAAVLALVGYSTLGWFGLIFALAPFVAVVVGLAGTKRLAEPGPSARMTELSSAIGWLLVGSTFSQALGYSAYVGASLLATSSQNAELGAFIAALFIARVPILLFQAVQAALLPRLASLLSAGHVREFIDGFSRLLLLVVGLSVVAIALALVVGPTFGTLLFGTSFVTSGVQLAALTTGCCLVVVALTLAQALIALRRYALPAVSWAVGFGVFLAILIPTSGSVFTRAEIAFVAGAAIATVLMALATIIGIRGVSGSGKVAA
jgi:O-antigen/teichoic acid export membrane protein